MRQVWDAFVAFIVLLCLIMLLGVGVAAGILLLGCLAAFALHVATCPRPPW